MNKMGSRISLAAVVAGCTSLLIGTAFSDFPLLESRLQAAFSADPDCAKIAQGDFGAD